MQLAQPQAAYLRELNAAKHHDHVLQRVESGAATRSEEATKEYIKALVATGRIDSANSMAWASVEARVWPHRLYPLHLLSSQNARDAGVGAFGSSLGAGVLLGRGAARAPAARAAPPLHGQLVPNERTARKFSSKESSFCLHWWSTMYDGWHGCTTRRRQKGYWLARHVVSKSLSL